PARRTPPPAPGTRSDVRVVRGVVTHALVRGEGRDLVIVPGIGCAAFVYDRLADALAPHFRVWSYDPPSHGRSGDAPPGGLRISRLTDHLAAWMREVGLTDAVVLGHSLGGEVAIDLAARSGELVSRLVLLAPTGVPDNPVLTLQLARLAVDAPRERPGLLARVWASYARCGPLNIVRIAADQRHHLTSPLLPLVRSPTLVVRGENDPAIRRDAVRTLCRLLPDVREERAPGAHAFWYPSAALVAGLVRDFTADLAPGHD
ncbi:alpha/beta fold hydrolase, partial [Deinococcus pimensis]|uniref:alpha/beta fold hydrolase n=1 Tax=Deinococcus pimensis TaxID=309888 RepID=UPI001B7F86A8